MGTMDYAESNNFNREFPNLSLLLVIFAHICAKNDKIRFSYGRFAYIFYRVRVQQFHGKSQNVVGKIQVREILRNFHNVCYVYTLTEKIFRQITYLVYL